ncbi:NAD(P)-dependent oxidoreductase [Bacillus sp. FSL K6-3431]|uniref:NAD(P)-dependent oxidoreductase n=1 Tax=Bacillus sp. FSL K6-3431 TaxID=2921500 RepID=UPI0030FC0688
MKKSIGFIGLGVMGKGIVRNLLSAGHHVYIYSRTKSKAEDILKEGAIWKETPKEIAESAEIIITMVGYPQDVEEVYFGKEGIIEGVNKESITVDMTTSTPTLAKKIDETAKHHGFKALDAPVSGGDIGAKNGTLSIMVGGDKDAFEDLYPVFQRIGGNIVYQGEAGAGQHTKMCNQIAIASTMIGVTEAIIYAKQSGLNPDHVLKSISQGAAGSWSMTNLIPRVLMEDYSPGFFIKHFVKDMGIALDEAENMELKLPGLKLAKEMYDSLVADGEGDSGTQALIKYWK